MTNVAEAPDPRSPIAVRCPEGRAQIRWLAERHQHHPEVVTLNPPACLRLEIHEVAEAALDNLGHDRDLMAGTRSAEILAVAWMQADGITDALFVDCQVHPLDRVRKAVEWLQAVGVRPWLCITRTHPKDASAVAVEALAAEYGGTTVHHSTLTRRFDDVASIESTPGEMPKVPYVDGIVFRPACRDLLSPEEFEVVDARFVKTVRRTRAALSSATDRQRGRGARRAIKRILEDAGDLDELIIDTRAVQVAALSFGFHVRVSMPALVGADATIPRQGQIERHDGWEKLARYRDPDVGAVAALYHAGFSPDIIPTLTLNDGRIHPDGSVRIDGPEGPFLFADPHARFLRALIIYRRLTAESSDSLLFHTHRDQFVRTHHVSAMLTRPATEVGVPIAVTPIRTKHLPEELWLTRHGITLELLTRKDAKHLRQREEA